MQHIVLSTPYTNTHSTEHSQRTYSTALSGTYNNLHAVQCSQEQEKEPNGPVFPSTKRIDMQSENN